VVTSGHRGQLNLLAEEQPNPASPGYQLVANS
jgi:hypothetical protein